MATYTNPKTGKKSNVAPGSTAYSKGSGSTSIGSSTYKSGSEIEAMTSAGTYGGGGSSSSSVSEPVKSSTSKPSTSVVSATKTGTYDELGQGMSIDLQRYPQTQQPNTFTQMVKKPYGEYSRTSSGTSSVSSTPTQPKGDFIQMATSPYGTASKSTSAGMTIVPKPTPAPQLRPIQQTFTQKANRPYGEASIRTAKQLTTTTTRKAPLYENKVFTSLAGPLAFPMVFSRGLRDFSKSINTKKEERQFLNSQLEADIFKGSLERTIDRTKRTVVTSEEVKIFEEESKKTKETIREQGINAGLSGEALDLYVEQTLKNVREDTAYTYYVNQDFDAKTSQKLANQLLEGKATPTKQYIPINRGVLGFGSMKAIDLKSMAVYQSLFFVNKQEFKKSVQEELTSRGYSKAQIEKLTPLVQKDLTARATGELGGMLSSEVMGETFGYIFRTNTFRKLSQAGTTISNKQIFSKMFGIGFKSTLPAGIIEGGYTALVQMGAREEKFNTKRLAIEMGIGGLFAGTVGGLTSGFAPKSPGISKTITLGAYISDPLEYPGDLLAKGPIKAGGGKALEVFMPKTGPVLSFSPTTTTTTKTTTKQRPNFQFNILNIYGDLSNTPFYTNEATFTRTPTTTTTRTPTTTKTQTTVRALVPTDTRTTIINPSENIPSNIFITIPSNVPSNVPTNIPTNTPVNVMTNVPTNTPVNVMTNVPTNTPVNVMTNVPTTVPTVTPLLRFPPPLPLPVGAGAGFGLGGSRKGKRSKFIDELFASQQLFSGLTSPKTPAIFGFGLTRKTKKQPIVKKKKKKKTFTPQQSFIAPKRKTKAFSLRGILF